jgi:AraC family transcriptional regulator, alkane utilization regulator
VDPLSEVLSVIRLSGAIHFLAEFRQPWAVSFSPPEILAARLKLPHGSVTPFHAFMDGTCWVTSGTLAPVRIESGEVVIFPRAGQHVIASDPGVTPVPIKDIYPQPCMERITTVRHGGSGQATTLICGFVHLDQQFDPLLNSLPDVICIRARKETLKVEAVSNAGRRVLCIDQEPEVEWWRASLRYLINETATPGPGQRAVLARLAESLFVQVLRWQLRHAVEGHDGWLAGLHDRQIGRVLTLLHASPERPWTVDELAKQARMSRAALAKRFVEMIGHSPIQYLARWRMLVARRLLIDSKLTVAEIAGRIGYESEAAFTRAFRRVVGLPPAAWRQANHSSSLDPPGWQYAQHGGTPIDAGRRESCASGKVVALRGR